MNIRLCNGAIPRIFAPVSQEILLSVQGDLEPSSDFPLLLEC